MKKVLEAADFAARKHTNQRRKGVDDIPYINHPLEVACLLAVTGGVTDEEVLSAAILHDTIEDTATTEEEIAARFGNRVLDYVKEVSDNKLLSKQERKHLQVVHAGTLSQGARLIKLGDKISNLRSLISGPPPSWGADRKIEYFQWAFHVVEGLRNTNEALELLFLKEYREGLAKLGGGDH